MRLLVAPELRRQQASSEGFTCKTENALHNWNMQHYQKLVGGVIINIQILVAE